MIPSFLLIWFFLEPPFFYYPTPSPPLPLKHRNLPHFALSTISRSTACYSCISDLRDGMAWWDLCNRTFFQYKEHLELFLYLLLPVGFTRPQRGRTADQGTSGRHLHLAKSVMVPILSHLHCPPCLSAVPHSWDIIKISSANYTKSCLNLLLLGQKYS